MNDGNVPLSMGSMGSYCCICSDASKSPASPLSTSTLGAEPPNRIKLLTSTHHFDETLPREFEFTAVLPAGFQPKDIFDRISSPIEEVVRDGYNASMVCYGPSSLKRVMSLGMPSRVATLSSTPNLPDVLAAYGQIGGILYRVFMNYTNTLQVGLSCWTIQGSNVKDLLSKTPDSQQQQGPIQFTTMRISSLSQALALLALVHSADLASHLFVRLALYCPENQQLSLLHFVDLGRVSGDEEREFLGLFDALVSDDLDGTGSNSENDAEKNQCVLTQFLAPLLAGNSKTYLLGFVDAHVPVATLDLLWVMSGVRLISCACVKLQNIDPELLDFQPFAEPIAPRPRSLDGPSLNQKLFGEKMRRRSSSPAEIVVPLPEAHMQQPVVVDTPLPSAPPVIPLLRLRRPSEQHTSLQSTAEPPPSPLASEPTRTVVEDIGEWKELLEAAHLPTVAPPAPSVEGLDPTSAWTVLVTEAQLLRKHYDGLLRVLKDQHSHNKHLENQIEELEHAKAEIDATYHVQMQDLKLANIDLRSKVRVMEAQTGMQSILDKYEAEIQNITTELDKVRAQNLSLELKLASNAAVDLRTRYRDVVKENVSLHDEVLALRKKERHFLSSKKVLDESAKKIDALSKLVTTKDDMLLEARLGEARLSAQVDQQQQKSLALQQQQTALAQENEKAAEELVAVKMYLASIQTEQKKAEMLDRFVKKHGSSLMSADKQRANTSIDEHAKKVLGAIKRAVPQVVPSVHKLIQRLHEQETSLLEYSSREMDLINLLVELATDQQALTLAQLNGPTTTRKPTMKFGA